MTNTSSKDTFAFSVYGSPDVVISIGENGLWLDFSSLVGSARISQRDLSKRLLAQSSFCLRLGQVLPLLVEQEIAKCTDALLCVDTEQVHSLYDPDYGLVDFLPAPAPYRVRVNSTGTLGYDNFSYKVEFFNGHRKVYASHTGPFLKRSASIYLLSKEVFETLKEIKSFNEATPSEKRDLRWALQCFSRIKRFEGEAISFDHYLKTQKVVEVSRVSVAVAPVSGGKYTLYPYFDDVPVQAVKETHLRLQKPQQIYEITQSDGILCRVVPTLEVRRALEVVSSVYRFDQANLNAFLEESLQKFSDADAIDVVNLSSLKALIPADQSQDASILAAPEACAAASVCAQVSSDIPETRRQDEDLAQAEKSLFEKRPSRMDKYDSVVADSANGEIAAAQELVIPVNENLQISLAAATSVVRDPTKMLSKVIAQNQSAGDQDFPITERLAGEWKSSADGLVFELPASLLREVDGRPFELHSYQKQGIAWLQFCLKKSIERSGEVRNGALLADDMGLGKTLQTLVFLAWCIESALPECLGKDLELFEPILIVSPLILLPVWEKELKKFFNASGAVFTPFLIMHGELLNRLKEPGGEGKNKKALSTEEIRRHRVIVTNYDTIKNYFHSLSQVPWSVVVADEAQEIKEPNTAVTVCMKALTKRFVVAVTGTPVENKLLDLWSIIDFVEPDLLGDLKTFKRNTEGKNVKPAVYGDKLKQILKYRTPSTYILRRTKESSLDGLPKRRVIVRMTPLTDAQIQVHEEVMLLFQAQVAEHRHFECIQRLLKIYQHIALDTSDYLDLKPNEYLDQSFKLRDCVDLLHEIKRRREKVLLFTRTIGMQMILKSVIESEFGPVEIINGSAATGVTSNSERQRVISEFEAQDGFGALILSPEVAGVGLTITAANNVIHYGRWWNPAKENQATDRVHRLGQTKDVNVYNLLSVTETFLTFDEKLHMMLASKMSLARDFLVPAGDWNVKESDLLRELAMEGASPALSRRPAKLISIDTLSNREFEALATHYWRKEGFTTYLLPTDAPEVVRLLAVRDESVILIGFEFSNEEAVRDQALEVMKSLEDFRQRYGFGRLGRLQWKAALATKQRLSKTLKHKLPKDIVVHDKNDLEQFLNRQKCSVSDLWREECNRIRNMQELSQLLK